jgi:hypothetical protein
MYTFRRIGAGFCGSVWAPDQGEPSAFKREDGGPGRSLLNDFVMHKQVLKSRSQLASQNHKGIDFKTTMHAQVPKCYQFIQAEDQEWWDQNLFKFPQGYSPCNILHSECIQPLSQNIREYLIDAYCPPPLISEIKASDANRDCLIRPYLGRRRLATPGRPSPFKAFSLRNFPLHIDQMEQLGICAADIATYAEMMAETLAMMHWDGEIDANDIEFVLATPRPDSRSRPLSNILGDHTMWVLDFDCCRKMPMDEKGVDQAVAAFFKNDPFYPRPNQELWKVFRHWYLRTSSNIVRNDHNDRRSGLPELFIKKTEDTRRT